MRYPALSKFVSNIKKILKSERGIALMMVLSSIALLSFIVGEATFTVQLNQKLAYDRLDHLRADGLAKSGLKLALLRIKAYTEVKKQIAKVAKEAGASASAVNQAVPKEMLEKIWSEPVTIPFSGDLSGLPGPVKDALTKFRETSSMTGRLYVKIESQSARFNLNASTPLMIRSAATPTPTPKSGSAGASPTPTPQDSGTGEEKTPAQFDPEVARKGLRDQIQQIFKEKNETDEKFRDKYRSLNPDVLVDEILQWADIRVDLQQRRTSDTPFKIAPFFHVSELLHLPSMDDELYQILSPLFYTGIMMGVNVNTVTDDVLRYLVPSMTKEERTAFFTHRDGDQAQGTYFKSPDDFYKYLEEKVDSFKGSKTELDEFKEDLVKRGIDLTVDELYFIVRIEASVEQAKQTLEAWVNVVEPVKTKAKTTNPAFETNDDGSPNSGIGLQKPSNLRITLMRYL